ncbi:MAG: hypothetical protein J6T57_01360 [Alphaproteobacteria bacterium]|nr:hypothetical protein [Alphaproteobacteria bacterium]
MTNEERKQEYEKQDAICKAKMAVVQPWLEQFAKEYNETHPGEIGTGFYDDVVILRGPHDDKFFWKTAEGNKLRERNLKGEISIVSVRWSGAAFVIEYKFEGNKIYEYQGQLFQAPKWAPVASDFIYEGKHYSVPLDVALAAKELHAADEYRGVLWGNMHESR